MNDLHTSTLLNMLDNKYMNSIIVTLVFIPTTQPVIQYAITHEELGTMNISSYYNYYCIYI